VECLPNLIELDLGDCLVRTEGALKLAKSLKNCQKIKIVNMAFGEIKIEGAMALMNVLPLQDLEFLDFNGNKFGDEGCEELQAMSDLSKLEK
jgi:Ran GTPase-activating protein 1